MKDILGAPFLKEMVHTTANMYRLGWDDRRCWYTASAEG